MCADWISFVKINTSPFDISLNISVWSAELWNASRQLTFPFLPQSISLNSTLSYFRSQDSQLFLFPQSNKTEKPFTITGKILKSSFFKCIGYCKGKMCEEDLCGHVGPKMRGELTNAHKRSATCVCIPGIIILPFSLAFTLSCPTYHSSLVLYSFFCIFFLNEKRN